MVRMDITNDGGSEVVGHSLGKPIIYLMDIYMKCITIIPSGQKV
jgi:hypothetical protein